MQRTEHSCGQGPRRATCVQLGVCDECYQDITSVFFVPVLLWFLLLLVFNLVFKCLHRKQMCMETHLI